MLQLFWEVLMFTIGGAMLFLTGARAAIWFRRSQVRRRTRARLYALVRL
jgi:hypothetical protein